MEEAKAYIETGILELYVLGQLTVREQKEVEDMAIKYPEVKNEINAIEVAMEQYAITHSIQPSAGLEQRILNIITSQEPALPQPQKEEIKIVSLNPGHSAATVKTLRFALAACIAMLVVSAVALYNAHDQLGEANQQIAALSADKDKFASTVSFMKEENKDLQEIATIAGDPTWTTVKLAGTAISPQAKMMVYWHKDGQHVMVDNTRMSLPRNDASHQYQLWAIVNGKPVDLGVFDAEEQPKKLLMAMKEVGAAQAFAVTLEKRGGSISPTMEKMIVQGGVAI